jgi:hypothetical protein
MRFHRRSLSTLTLLGSIACTSSPPVGESSTTLDLETSDGDDFDDSGDSNDQSDGTTGGTEFSSVSILVVLDNSGSMGDIQVRVAAGLVTLISTLDKADIDWRLAVTTSDNGNPWCPAGSTTPEGGKFVLSSCKTRLNDFLFSDTVDVQDSACLDICPLSDFEIVPTTTAFDPSEVARPWLERTGGMANFDVPVGDLLGCVIPQGVNGCGFEQQLESGYLAIARTQLGSEANYGFLDDDRLPVVVYVSDEIDTSYDKEWADIFAQDGNKVFWSDPSASFPTSAVGWNAGVTCTGGGSPYDSCEPADKDIDGNVGAEVGDAVLHTIARYTGQLAEHEALAFGILGVAENGEPYYANTDDLSYQDSFGIGPGCVAADGDLAVPPVRMRAVVEATGQRLYGVCESDYGPAFADIGQRIVDRL